LSKFEFEIIKKKKCFYGSLIFVNSVENTFKEPCTKLLVLFIFDTARSVSVK